MLGCLPTSLSPWELVSPHTSLAPGPDLEGSCIVASSTPVRISVSLDRGPQAARRSVSTRVEGKLIQRKRVRAPEEIPDAEHELLIESVCAIDVAKAMPTAATIAMSLFSRALAMPSHA